MNSVAIIDVDTLKFAAVIAAVLPNVEAENARMGQIWETR